MDPVDKRAGVADTTGSTAGDGDGPFAAGAAITVETFGGALPSNVADFETAISSCNSATFFVNRVSGRLCLSQLFFVLDGSVIHSICHAARRVLQGKQ